jgi:ethanolamine utilization protein EutN
MLMCRVEGYVVATKKHSSLEGWKLTICQPIGNDGAPEGPPQIAIDRHGAAMHQRVLISSDGAATRKLLGDDKSPARWVLICVLDEQGGRTCD